MSGVNWSLLGSPNQSFQNALNTGMEFGKMAVEAHDRRELRQALAAVAANPEDQAALAAVFERNPELGAKLMDRADTAAFGRDTAEMMAPQGQPNALLGLAGTPQSASPSSPPNALATIAPATPNASFQEAVAPYGQTDPQTAQEAPQGEVAEIDLSSLGEPTTGADKAFLSMVRRDPIKALKIRSALRDNFVDQAKAESEFVGYAMAELSRANDQTSWNAALQSVLPEARALGMDIARVVPTAYPGPEGVAELMRRAQPVKEQLDLMLREANMDADNARADRNTSSLIETREGRLDEYRRHNRAGEGNTRRGQDLTDGRARDRGARGGRGAKPKTDIPVMASPEEAMKLPSGTRFRTQDGRVKVRP